MRKIAIKLHDKPDELVQGDCERRRGGEKKDAAERKPLLFDHWPCARLQRCTSAAILMEMRWMSAILYDKISRYKNALHPRAAALCLHGRVRERGYASAVYTMGRILSLVRFTLRCRWRTRAAAAAAGEFAFTKLELICSRQARWPAITCIFYPKISAVCARACKIKKEKFPHRRRKMGIRDRCELAMRRLNLHKGNLDEFFFILFGRK